MIDKQDDKDIRAFAENIMNTFNKDNETDMYIDISEADGNKLITNLIKATNFVYANLTEDFKTNLDFTHLANKLIVQDMLDYNEKAYINEQKDAPDTPAEENKKE